MELDRKILIFESSKDSKLRYSYNYLLMREIYDSMNIIDSKNAKELHDKGYRIENKIYKLFTHQLFIENAEYQNDAIYIKSESKIRVSISGIKSVVDNIVKGFMKKGLLLLDGNEFKLIDVKNDKNIKLDNISLYKVRTPIIASVQDDKRRIKYLSIYENEYFRVIAENLKRKYKLVYEKDYSGELYFDVEDLFNVKRKVISVKQGAVVGYSDFELYIQADKDMQKVAYFCGIGSNNSLGMGFMTHIVSRGNL